VLLPRNSVVYEICIYSVLCHTRDHLILCDIVEILLIVSRSPFFISVNFNVMRQLFLILYLTNSVLALLHFDAQNLTSLPF